MWVERSGAPTHPRGLIRLPSAVGRASLPKLAPLLTPHKQKGRLRQKWERRARPRHLPSNSSGDAQLHAQQLRLKVVCDTTKSSHNRDLFCDLILGGRALPCCRELTQALCDTRKSTHKGDLLCNLILDGRDVALMQENLRQVGQD